MRDLSAYFRLWTLNRDGNRQLVDQMIGDAFLVPDQKREFP